MMLNTRAKSQAKTKVETLATQPALSKASFGRRARRPRAHAGGMARYPQLLWIRL
jgi:hypothetical protein